MELPDCPPWCAGDHEETHSSGAETAAAGFAETSLHSTLPLTIPVVSLFRLPDGSEHLEGETLDVVLFQHQHPAGETADAVASEEWVFIGSDSNALTITKESAQRLYRQLGTVLLLGGGVPQVSGREDIL